VYFFHLSQVKYSMIIRQETADEYEVVDSLIKKAFAHAEYADGNEHDLVSQLRKSEAYIPQLSLVAERNGEIVGHIMFTRATVGDHVILALAPLSVLPEYQHQGIGTALIEEGHRRASALGYGYSVVVGSETYYPRMGYLPADAYGIKPSFDVPSENFMAYRLHDRAPDICGVIKYAKEFCID
jgi:predicted N-acetyltransferase YhbS